ncbi:FecCD family ABC transporter permease [Clostridium saccharobutylicum]|uniref:Putative siderophore transport system permease protein YfiZ n=1 Tax=Clostridium saccharobutylicum TaxID=169679 RepID=A0A1S8N1X1_CLOSA|nr:iron ABC transporter permease [Clostridium saccharobutylicum]OOM10378.1 putative siderophore transport system permease protein YfiZ precursor [Clostridium saccharobutylicum]
MQLFKINDVKNNNKLTLEIIIVSLIILFIGIIINIYIGSINLNLGTVIKAIFIADGTKENLVIRTIRLPRAIMSIVIGGNLAVAGVLMQGITRNPLASPQVFGINSGAAFFAVASMAIFPNLADNSLVYFAFIGAALSGILVYFIGSIGGMMPVKLALAGMAIHFLLSSFTQGIILIDENSLDKIIHWLVGSVSNTNWDNVLVIMPWTIIGLLSAVFLASSMTILDLGEEVAKGLGEKTELIRIIAGIVVIILAGVCVSVAGPIGFIGLIVPHIVKHFVGTDYRIKIPVCILFGAILLVYADIISRFIAYPFESPVGIVTAIIGGPFFLYLAQRKRGQKK